MLVFVLIGKNAEQQSPNFVLLTYFGSTNKKCRWGLIILQIIEHYM